VGVGLRASGGSSDARGCSDECRFSAEKAARAVRRDLCFYALSTVPVDVRLPSICARSMDQNRPTAALQIGSTALRVWTAVPKTFVGANVQYTRPHARCKVPDRVPPGTESRRTMPPVRKPLPVDHSLLNEMLAIRLQQLEIENGGMEAFLPKTGLARGTYYTILRGIGNPTLRTVERIASSLHMSVLELLGFRGDDARRALKRSGVDYDELVSAIAKKNRADRALARQTRSRKLPS
jgi:hypothetical protein